MAFEETKSRRMSDDTFLPLPYFFIVVLTKLNFAK